MKVYLCNMSVELDNIPANFEAEVQNAFMKSFPNAENVDKIAFIDKCVANMHRVYDDRQEVNNFIKNKVCTEIDRTGKLKINDVWSVDTMLQCYKLGKNGHCLSSPYTEETVDNYKMLQLVYRLVKAVINCGVPESDWIYNEKGEMLCSNCREENFELVKYNYCPECGAKMKGDSEDEDNNGDDTGTA